MKWTHEHFTGVWNLRYSVKLPHERFPSGVDWDHTTKEHGVYRMTNKSWSPRVDDELGNYDYLLGIDVGLPAYLHVSDTDRLKVDHNHPEVAKDLLSWGPWVLQVRLPNDMSDQVPLPEAQKRTHRQRVETDSDWMQSNTWIASSSGNSYVLETMC